MLRILQEAGFFGYLVLGVGLLALPGAIFTWIKGRRVDSQRRRVLLGVAWVAGAMLILGLGVLGYLFGMKAVGGAIAHADPGLQAELLRVGRAEASQNIVLGAVAAAVPALCGALLIWSGWRRGRGQEEPGARG